MSFLFRVEREPSGVVPGAAYRLDDLDLASRLSFFLWSSIPDDELREAAVRGTLTDPAVLERQIQRMLRDPRSTALVDNFVARWLEFHKVADLGRWPKLAAIRRRIEAEPAVRFALALEAGRRWDG